MATQTKTRHDETPLEDVEGRIRDLNERILQASKKAGQAQLDIYEKTLTSIAGFQERVGDASQLEWVSAIAHAQSDYTRQLADAYTSALRPLVK